jgi:hypothetical protein
MCLVACSLSFYGETQPSLSEKLKQTRAAALEKQKQLDLERVPAHPNLTHLIPNLLINMSDAANEGKPCYEIEGRLLFNQDWERLYGTTNLARSRRLDAIVAFEAEWNAQYPDLKCIHNNCRDEHWCSADFIGTLKWCWEQNTGQCCTSYYRPCS